MRTYEFDPLEYIGVHADPADLKGGDPAANAGVTRKVLEGAKGPCRDIACLNAAAGIAAGGKARDIREGWKAANESIDSGRALKVLEGMIRITTAG